MRRSSDRQFRIALRFEAVLFTAILSVGVGSSLAMAQIADPVPQNAQTPPANPASPPAGISSAGTVQQQDSTSASAAATAGATPPANNAPAAPTAAAESAQPRTYTIPAGTKVLLALRSGVNTKTAAPGDGVYLSSIFPVALDGRVLMPAGVYVQGQVDRVVRPGHVKGRAQLLMHFTYIIYPSGAIVSLPGAVHGLPGSAGPKTKDEEGTIEAPGTKGKDIGAIAAGAGTGAEVGGIAGAATGHVGAGLGYGSLAGAAAGAIYTLFTPGNDVELPAGTQIEMVLQRPLVVEEKQLNGNSLDPAGLSPVSTNPPLPKANQRSRILCPYGLGCP